VVTIDISSARLVPAPGSDGWLCRLPSAVAWLPGSDQDAAGLIAECLTAGGPTELLGRVGSRLADPKAPPWPAFAIVAARGPDLVAVVHGPVEVVVDHEGHTARLYGGDEIGSWLNRLLRGATALRAGRSADDDGTADLREGVIRSGGFALTAVRDQRRVRSEVRHEEANAQAQARSLADSPTVAQQFLPGGAEDLTIAEQATVVDQAVFGDHMAVADHHGEALPAGGAPAKARRSASVLPLGKLTWDNGEVHELRGGALVGRDVAGEEDVVAGKLGAVVPEGQNDSMSRVHAELRAQAGEVVVVDRGSTNGTFVWDEATKAWQRLSSGEPHAIRSGTVVAFGERTATFEAAPTAVI